MSRVRHIAQGQPVPEWFVDQIQDFISTGASANFRLTLLNSTTIQVVAGTNNDMVTIGLTSPAGVNGWRHNIATVTAAHPGGAAGYYDVWATGSAAAYSNNPSPPPTELDSTVYAFGLKITATGATPSGTGSEALYRKIGQVYWNGTAITELTQLIGMGHHAKWHNPGGEDVLDYPAIAEWIHLRGTIGARPAAATTNRGYLYLATDVNGGTLYRSTGSAWEQTGLGVLEIVGSQATAQAILMFGTQAARPAPVSGNRYYYYHANDIGVLYQNQTGSVWQTMFVTQAAGDVSGSFPNLVVLKASGSFALTGIVSPASIGGNQNDYNPSGLAGASSLRLTSSVDVLITGLQGGSVGRVISLFNIGVKTITIADESSSSSAANRFSLPTSGLTLSPNESAMFEYDSTSNRWRPMAGAEVIGATIVTSLPPSPYEGQDIILEVDAAGHILWHLIRRNGVWAFIGGPPVRSFIAVRDAMSNYGSYINGGTVGPSVTVPETGLYQIRHGADFEGHLSGTQGLMSYSIGGTGASDNDAVALRSDLNRLTSNNSKRDKTLTKGAALVGKYRNLDTETGTDFWSNRWIEILPTYLN